MNRVHKFIKSRVVYCWSQEAHELQTNNDTQNCPVTIANITTPAYLGSVNHSKTNVTHAWSRNTQPLHLFSSLPDSVSPVLEIFSNINVGPKALA